MVLTLIYSGKILISGKLLYLFYYFLQKGTL